MILAGFLVAFLLASCTANESASNDEVPFVLASQGTSDEGKTSNLLPNEADAPLTGIQAPEERGRSDIEIEKDTPFGGYFYPKPTKPFYLPPFKALGAEGATQFADDGTGVIRAQRSPQYRRWRPQNQTPPPFIPGFIPPSPIRPLPAVWSGRPAGY